MERKQFDDLWGLLIKVTTGDSAKVKERFMKILTVIWVNVLEENPVYIKTSFRGIDYYPETDSIGISPLSIRIPLKEIFSLENFVLSTLNKTFWELTLSEKWHSLFGATYKYTEESLFSKEDARILLRLNLANTIATAVELFNLETFVSDSIDTHITKCDENTLTLRAYITLDYTYVTLTKEQVWQRVCDVEKARKQLKKGGVT